MTHGDVWKTSEMGRSQRALVDGISVGRGPEERGVYYGCLRVRDPILTPMLKLLGRRKRTERRDRKKKGPQAHPRTNKSKKT
eukprot:7990690-Heterocapsa_arctica.AAC.1